MAAVKATLAWMFDGALVVDCTYDDVTFAISSVHGVNSSQHEATVDFRYDAQDSGPQPLHPADDRTISLPANTFFWPHKGGVVHEIQITVNVLN